MNCPHRPPCPAADQSDREAARLVATHPEQGWNLLCNGVITFDDTGDLLPDGRSVAPHRVLPHRRPTLPGPTKATDTRDGSQRRTRAGSSWRSQIAEATAVRAR